MPVLCVRVWLLAEPSFCYKIFKTFDTYKHDHTSRSSVLLRVSKVLITLFLLLKLKDNDSIKNGDTSSFPSRLTISQSAYVGYQHLRITICYDGRCTVVSYITIKCLNC